MFRRKSRSQSTSAVMPASRAFPATRATANRCNSVPTFGTRIRGILKVTTVDESLHNPYGIDSKENKGIQFKDIQIREYARTIGDNPSCSSGPPIGISWEYDPDITVLSIDKYEELRPDRRAHFEMVLPRDIRQSMLRKEWQVTQSQIAAAVRTNIRIKRERRQTVTNLGKHNKMEERLEKVGKSMIRTLTLKKSTRKELEELERQMEQVKEIRTIHQMERMEVSDDDLEAGEIDEEAEDNDNSEKSGSENKKEPARSHKPEEAPVAGNLAGVAE